MARDMKAQCACKVSSYNQLMWLMQHAGMCVLLTQLSSDLFLVPVLSVWLLHQTCSVQVL